MYEKMLAEAGLNIYDCYICARRPDTDSPSSYASVDSALAQYKPPFIFAVNEVGAHYLTDLRPRSTKDSYKTQLNKYVGSLLQSDLILHTHYIIPIHGPDKCAQDWVERNIVTYIDFQKVKDEYDYWRATGTLRPLRERKLICDDTIEFGELCSHLDRIRRSGRVSNDIETVYPKKDSAFYPHPGYAFVIGFADSPDFGVSLRLFRETPSENIILWREIQRIYDEAEIIGQNFINFDSYFIKALGFNIQLQKVSDTLVRHHILWPELPHKLQFLTRQYTRQPYYKDEGKMWNIKHLRNLMHYNALDVTVTYEVWEGEEQEFVQRPHLKGVAA